VNDFAGDDGNDLHPQLKNELAAYGHMYDLSFVRSTAKLIDQLAVAIDSEFPSGELEKVPGLGDRVSRAIAGEHPASLDALLQSAFGQPVRWTSVSWRVEDAVLVRIISQRVYRIPDNREVAVIQSEWALSSSLTLNGPKEIVDAGFHHGTGRIKASVEIWATRQQGVEIEAEVSHASRIVPVIDQVPG
jgi:hypothetical protein